MYCPKCGKNLNENTRFCPNCGYRIIKENEEEKTKEINVGIIKEVEQNPNYSFIEKKKEKNNNSLIVMLGIVILLLFIIVLLIVPKNEKRYVFEEDKKIYCNDNSESNICPKEEEVVEVDFDSMDFTKYDFSESSSTQAFYESVVNILIAKGEDGNKYCNDANYTNASNNLNKNLDLDYSYLCGMDTTFLNNLKTRLEFFYKTNNINDKIVDAYIVGRGGLNEYANFTGQIIGSNNLYSAYLRRVHMSVQIFKDYDKLQKSYERDLEGGFHPKNSIAEDIIVHETAHALDFYITAKRYNINRLIIEDFSKYNDFYMYWGEQSYAKEVVQKAVERVNQKSTIKKTEEELRSEISGYASITNQGTIMYCETFAEAMVDYLSNGENASPLSVEMYKIVQEDLQNL